jgi:hypothetical protein
MPFSPSPAWLLTASPMANLMGSLSCPALWSAVSLPAFPRVFTNVDDQTQEDHQTAVQDVTGKLDDLAAIKASFTAIQGGSCYDCTMTDLTPGRGDRCFMTSLSYDVLMVLPSV